MARSPLSLARLMDTWRESVTATGLSAGIVLGGDQRLVEVAQQHFAAGGTLPATWARPLDELADLSSVPGELLVLFVPAEDEADTIAALERSSAKGGVLLAVSEGSAATDRVSYPQKAMARLSFSDTPRGWRRLFETCADISGDHVVALGRRYPVVRAAAARRVVYRAAAQNALIGAAFFLPGADLPAMTLNQIRMVLSLAGVYGAEIGRERAVELIGVAGVGLGLRALARSFLRSTPGLGWVIKASTGFTGTLAVGFAAMRYFEKGAPAASSKVVALARPLRR